MSRIDLDTPIDEALGPIYPRPVTGVRVRMFVRNERIVTLRDLVTRTPQELLRQPNFGRRSLKLVVERLDELGLRLTESESSQPSPWDRLRDAAKLALLFHSASPWDEEKRAEWRRITGTDEATTKVMCDHIRAVLTPPGAD